MPRNESAFDSPPEEITVEVGGSLHAGTFRTGRGYVMLDSSHGRATAPRGRFAARQVAAMLLERLVREAAARTPPAERAPDG